MTASQFVAALLDEGEDPKDFLKRLAPKPEFPPPDEVRYVLDHYFEDDFSFEGEFGDEDDEEFIRQELANGNDWAWCKVRVTAQWIAPDGTTFEGHDYLGGCSYRSEEDFKQPGGYYDDMKKEAYADLQKAVEAATKDL